VKELREKRLHRSLRLSNPKDPKGGREEKMKPEDSKSRSTKGKKSEGTNKKSRLSYPERICGDRS
jgi:hypothetical protein